MLDLIFLIALIIIIIIQSIVFLLPIGNESSTVRRLPWVTFSIMTINVLVFFVTLPSTVEESKNWERTRIEVEKFLLEHEEIKADKKVRDKLISTGLISEAESRDIDNQLKEDKNLESHYKTWLNGAEATELRKEFNEKIAAYEAVRQSMLYYKYGLAPNGDWKFYQLITNAFMHGSLLHLVFNMVFFFAVGFSLEDLWGRGVFLGFYLMSAVASVLPLIIDPISVPSIGASGAVSATMGAFLFRLHSKKIKIFWITFPFFIIMLIFGKKPFGTINIPAFVYLPFYFISQVVYLWLEHKLEASSGTGYSVHIAGFVFGAVFALVMKGARAEELYINPKIEAKVSFETSPDVTRALEYLDRGEIDMAERKLKGHLLRNPNDPNTILALIQVYQRTLDIEQLNKMYSRLIQHHLSNNDREAALYAYDHLLSSFPDDKLEPSIPARDWVTICEYLVEAEMLKEAAVEYERLAKAHPADALTVRACVQGGEAALTVFDNERALRLFEKAQALNAQGGLKLRTESGLEKSKTRLEHRPTWVKEPPKAQTLPKDMEEQKVPF